ncbi:kinetochore protein NDC8 [Nematocida displodere]|uniref:Kinetochore protein NDC80 n=1 Tax=Nematocida displodere TaxID=1805483 RepID=A0A177ECJ6_9MICR|nr:kinetochore protein NDC8 [Nematocida displodere]
MRRATMAGAPSKHSISFDTGRATFTEDPRRKQRNVRDKQYQTEAAHGIVDFLAGKEYDMPVSIGVLLNPSLKEFQRIFKFIQQFIDTTSDFSRKFEEEVIIFLKGIKYPYASEINRSQLVAITPHTWPVLLSMLAWLVALVQTLEGRAMLCQETGVDEESRKIFYQYLYSEYSAYMEGRDSASTGGQQVEKAISEINQERLKAASEIKQSLEALKKEISALNDGAKEIQQLEEKKYQVQNDLEKLESLRKLNENKHAKYRKALEEAQQVLSKIVNEASSTQKARNDLEDEIKMQTIKPEDLEEMIEERDALIKALDETKRAKTTLLKEIEELNKKLRALVEEAERYLFDLTSMPSGLEICLKVEKTRVFTDLGECSEYEVTGNIEAEHQRAKEVLEQLTKTLTSLEERLEEETEKHTGHLEAQKALGEEIRQKEERIKVHAQVYVEKKEASEEEYRRAVGRVDKAETELLKILAEGDNGLFQCEQNLERLKIKKGRAASQIAAEEAEIQRVAALVAANLQGLQERTAEAYTALGLPNPQ